MNKILFPLILTITAGISGLTVHFLETARVTGPDIRLSDIAAIEGAQTKETKAFTGTRVGRAALPGFVLTLEARKIRRLFLDEAVRTLAEPVEFSGAAAITVRTGSRTLSEAALREEIRKQVTARMPWTLKEAHVSIDACPTELILPDMENHLEIEPATDCDWRGSEQFRVRVLHGQEELKGFPVTVRVRVFNQVCVAAAKLKRGATLSAGDLRVETREITEIREPLFTTPDSCLGRKLTRTVLSGSVLLSGWVEIPPLVRKGEKVRILYRANETEVCVEGTSRGEGALGDRIRVRNEMTRKTVDAWVSGLSEVELNRSQGGAL